MNVPDDLLYTKDHEWVRFADGMARVGITDYAQDALGDIVYVQLPEVGAAVAEHDAFSEIESTKSVNDVYAPVTGTVSAVNDDLSSHPELLNSDPYGGGWLCEISVAGGAEEGLMSPAEYRSLIG